MTVILPVVSLQLSRAEKEKNTSNFLFIHLWTLLSSSFNSEQNRIVLEAGWLLLSQCFFSCCFRFLYLNSSRDCRFFLKKSSEHSEQSKKNLFLLSGRHFFHLWSDRKWRSFMEKRRTIEWFLPSPANRSAIIFFLYWILLLNFNFFQKDH